MSADSPAENAAAAPWYADGLRFSCTQCGNCCGGAPGYVWVSPDELTQIAQHLGMHPVEFMNQHTRREGRGRSLLEHANGDCVFLVQSADGKRRCGIYPVRPQQCRTWPFWNSNIRSPRSWQMAGRGCPGIDQGSTHPLPVIQAALRANEEAGLRL